MFVSRKLILSTKKEGDEECLKVVFFSLKRERKKSIVPINETCLIVTTGKNGASESSL